jgi:hypothetical protein
MRIGLDGSVKGSSQNKRYIIRTFVLGTGVLCEYRMLTAKALFDNLRHCWSTIVGIRVEVFIADI